MANFSISNISNIPSNDNSDIGGIAFFLAHISECLPYVIFVSLGSIIGVLGTLFKNN